MALTPAQKQILRDVKAKDGRITLKELTAAYGNHYYHNGAKYLGEILSRMVNQNLLVRVKPGVYTLGTGKKNSKRADAAFIENQVTLF